MAHFCVPDTQKPGFPLQVLGFAYANPVGFPLQSLARKKCLPKTNTLIPITGRRKVNADALTLSRSAFQGQRI
jgi:hypothetical protein